ncbi:glycerophosphodiester phosphodiesterase [Chloroflexota bacterium]
MIKKIFIILIELTLLLGVIYMVFFVLAEPIPGHPFFDPEDDVLVIAHRGGRRLWPENTLYAYQKAAELGVDVIEMDLHSTQDGALVMMHDDTVDRTTDGNGAIQDHSLAALQALDAGYNWSDDDGATYPYRGQGIVVPTLEEVFATLPDARMNIEIKQTTPSIIQPLCEMIRDHGMTERVLIASFDQDTIRAFRSACPEVATTAGEDEVLMLYGLSFVYLGYLYSPSAEAVQVPEQREPIYVLIPRFVEAAQGRNMDLHVWTVNEVDDMQRMLDSGVDGMITDYPDRLLDLLAR